MLSALSGSSDRFLADLDRIQASANEAERQMSSGLRVQVPSDAPDSVSQILQLRATMAVTTQRQTNLSMSKTQVDTAEQSLETAVQAVQQAATLAAQGVTGTATATDRQTIAQQVSAVQDQLMALSNASVGGVYVFSGDQDQSPAYARDDAQPNGVDSLLTTSATHQAEDATGATFSTGRTAQQIFDDRNTDGSPAADNVFAAVHNLQVALNNNDTAGIQAAQTALGKAGDYLNQQLAFYGSVQDRVAAASTQFGQITLQQQTQLSALQDADVTQAILELTQSSTDQQAALAAQAEVPRTSLFDFLK